MWFQVNPRSPVPVYQQVVEGIKDGVAKGAMKAGDKIPSIRELAVELMLNHNTVAKAYQQLEREHVIEIVRGRGTFVTLTPMIPNREGRTEAIRETMRRLLIEAHHLQMTDTDLLNLLREVMENWRTGDSNRK